MSSKMIRSFIPALLAIVLLGGCAGVEGRPDYVKKRLQEKYIGKPLSTVVLDIGSPESSLKFNDGRIAYTWRRQTTKYQNNLFIKSDERCVITMITDPSGNRIEQIGEVDDSLGAFNLSYAVEQLKL
jgi:hypothetical protein